MKYENPSFSVLPPNSDEYRDNWDRVFGKTPYQRAMERHEKCPCSEEYLVFDEPIGCELCDPEGLLS